MIENQFTEDDLAALYDRFHPPDTRGDYAFYVPLIMSAASVLDVGCGTGALLRGARDAGHRGRLCGIDPAAGMLNQARRRTDIEWILGDLSSVRWKQEFELVVMTGHAFQQLITDDDIRTALGAIRSALTGDGCFVFETRNPLIRGWESWNTDYSGEATTIAGVVVHRETQVHMPVEGDVVRFTATYSSSDWEEPRVSTSALRFLGVDTLSTFLADAGLTIVEQFGDWNRSPLSPTSPEIITVALRGDSGARQ